MLTLRQLTPSVASNVVQRSRTAPHSMSNPKARCLKRPKPRLSQKFLREWDQKFHGNNCELACRRPTFPWWKRRNRACFHLIILVCSFNLLTKRLIADNSDTANQGPNSIKLTSGQLKQNQNQKWAQMHPLSALPRPNSQDARISRMSSRRSPIYQCRWETPVSYLIITLAPWWAEHATSITFIPHKWAHLSFLTCTAKLQWKTTATAARKSKPRKRLKRKKLATTGLRQDFANSARTAPMSTQQKSPRRRSRKNRANQPNAELSTTESTAKWEARAPSDMSTRNSSSCSDITTSLKCTA